jgi:hypothetical protein
MMLEMLIQMNLIVLPDETCKEDLKTLYPVTLELFDSLTTNKTDIGKLI